MKKQYKLYRIVNLINDKKYIGYTEKELSIRFQQHLDLATKGEGYYLHAAMKKYGVKNFRIELIKTSRSLKSIRSQEKELILREGDYNIHVGGLGGDTLTRHPDRENILLKMSEAHLKNQKRGKEHPRYIEVPEEIRVNVIEDYFSFTLPSPVELIKKYKLNNKDMFDRIFKEAGDKLYRSKVERFKRNPENLKRLKELYVVQKRPLHKIAEESGLSSNSISKLLREELDMPGDRKLSKSCNS